MEHRSDRQHGIHMAQAKNFVEAATKRMQHQGAVGIDNALGMSGCAGGEAHGGAVVFVNKRVSKIIASLREQIFVIQAIFRHGVAAIGDDDHSFEGNILAEFFVKRQEYIVDQKEPVAGLLGDACNFMGMETKIQSMQDAAGTRNAEEGLQ